MERRKAETFMRVAGTAQHVLGGQKRSSWVGTFDPEREWVQHKQESGRLSLQHEVQATKYEEEEGGEVDTGSAVVSAEQLSLVPLFRTWSRRFLSDLAKNVGVRHAVRDEVIVKEGDVHDMLFLIARGGANVFMGGVHATTLKVGDFIGEFHLLGLECRSNVTVKIVGASTVVGAILRDTLFQTIEDYPREKRAFLHLCRMRAGRRNVSFIRRSANVNLFRGLSSLIIDQVDATTFHRLYFPEEVIIARKSCPKDVYILMSGEVTRVKPEVELPAWTKAGSGLVELPNEEAQEDLEIFGETGFLGLEEVFTEPVVAKSVCHIGILFRVSFLNILHVHREALRVDHMKSVIEQMRADSVDSSDSEGCEDSASLRDIRCFRQVGCNASLLNYLAERLEERAYLPGQRILEKTTSERKMYMLSCGCVEVLKDGKVPETKRRRGEIFAEALLLGLEPRPSITVVAKGFCYMKVLREDVLVEALRLAPPIEKQNVMMVAYSKIVQHAGDLATFPPLVAAFPPSVAEQPAGQAAAKEGAPPLESAGDVAARPSLRQSASHRHSSVERHASPDRRVSARRRISAERHAAAERSTSEYRQSLGHAAMELRASAEGRSTSSRNMSERAMPAEESRGKMLTRARTPGRFPSGCQPARPWQASRASTQEFSSPRSLQNMADVATCEYKTHCHDLVTRALSKSRFFASLDHDLSPFVKDLASVSLDRVFLPGDLIIEENMVGDSMFVLISGLAQVYNSVIVCKETKRKSVLGMVESGNIVGELCFLGVAPMRTATIEAKTICCMWEVTQEAAMPITSKHAEVSSVLLGAVVSHMESTVPGRFDALPMFKDFDRKFKMLVGLYCERRAHFAGNIIFKENEPCSSLCVLNVGRADMVWRKTFIRTFDEGSHFNAACMLGTAKACVCTLKSILTCHTLLLSSDALQQALEQYPCRHEVHELRKQEHAANDQLKREARATWKKSASTRLVQAFSWKRNSHKMVTGPDMLKKIMEYWHRRVVRKKLAQRSSVVFDSWVHKQRKAVCLRIAVENATCGGVVQPLSAFGENELVKAARKVAQSTRSPRFVQQEGAGLFFTRERKDVASPEKHLPMLQQGVSQLKEFVGFAEAAECKSAPASAATATVCRPPVAAATAEDSVGVLPGDSLPILWQN